jgi:hypothetical protein
MAPTGVPEDEGEEDADEVGAGALSENRSAPFLQQSFLASTLQQYSFDAHSLTLTQVPFASNHRLD